MLHKRSLAGKKVLVTFAVPAMKGVESLHVCGDFNNWSETATPLTRKPDGSWSVEMTLDAGQSYRFRYKDNYGEWHNDPAADAYVPNDFGNENSVLDLAAVIASTEAVRAAAARTAPARKPAAGRKHAPAAGNKKARGGKRPRGRRA
jgi:1,4-alpha-glucan branching enzyme